MMTYSTQTDLLEALEILKNCLDGEFFKLPSKVQAIVNDAIAKANKEVA